jgi:hypothetical protein
MIPALVETDLFVKKAGAEGAASHPRLKSAETVSRAPSEQTTTE